jgi:hypothetical protein
MPAPTTPTIYQSVVPLQSYQQTADYLARLKQQTQDIQEQRYAQSGTPEELGVRQAATRQQAAGTYLSSLPTGDKWLEATTGVVDRYAPAREAAQQNFTQAQQDYAEALKKLGNKPAPAYADAGVTPSWATATIPEGMPGYDPNKKTT